MKRIAIALVCLVSLWGAAAQDNSGDWFWGKPITSIQWEGLRHVDRKELDSTVRPFVGRNLTEEVWADLQAQVYGLDWFESTEIQITLLASALAFYLFLAHSLTSTRPFLDLRLLLNRNYSLGLALVAKIVGDHDGVIECDSVPGRTIFRVLLPQSRGEEN